MNKGITVIILGVLLGAMGLVLYTQTQQPTVDVSTGGVLTSPAVVSTAGAPSGGAAPVPGVVGGVPSGVQQNDIVRIEPPMSNALSPVVVSTGNAGDAPRVVSPPSTPAVPGSNSGAHTPQDVAHAPGDARPADVPAKPTGSGGATLTPVTSAPTPKTPVETAKSPAATPTSQPTKTPDVAKTPATVPPAKGPETSKPSADTGKNAGSRTVKSVSLQASGKQVTLRIEADSAITCKPFLLTAPDRLVVDLPGSWQGVHAPSVPQNRIVKAARAGSQPSGPRLVLDLERAAKFEIIKQGDKVIEIRVQ